MKQFNRQSVKTGVIAGLLVGVFFAVLEMIGAAAMGASALSPWHAFASTVLGRGATQGGGGGTIFVGVIAHFVLCAIYGGVYGLYVGALPDEARRSWPRQAFSGLIYGVLLYVLNFQIIARLIYPWFLGANQLWQFVLHTLFFGIPLGLMMAYAANHEVRAPSEARHA